MISTQSSSPTPISPLAFTRAYQQYRSDASRMPFADTRLLQAARFWTANDAALDNPAYVTYRLEDIPPLLATLNPDHLDDLRPTELEEVAEFVEHAVPLIPPSPHENSLPSRVDIKRAHSGAPLRPCSESSVGVYGHTPFRPESGAEHDSPQAERQSAAIWEHAAKQWLYLGEPSRALDALQRSGHSDPVPTDELGSILTDGSTCDATEIPGVLALRVEASHPKLARWLRDFDAAWATERETGDANRAMCLLVEYDANGSPVRGRLRRLEGKVEAIKRGVESDEVIFHHQVKSPDDPFVGTVYASFDALRQIDNRRAASMSGGPRYRGRFSFNRDGGETYSGDSIGLSAFAVAFGDQWGREVHRERRQIGQTVAFTGGIGPDGSVQPVSPDSLPLKVERAFHSPITHLVVPEANRKATEVEAERLRQAYPRRRLHIIGIERPSDIIADHNILHPEKLCPGEFAIRKAAKYSRSVKVQVPVLVVLGYLLLCLIYPKAWLFFDWNPQHVRMTESGFDVVNAHSQALWSKSCDCLCDTIQSISTVGDLDGDGRNEVAYMPKANEASMCKPNADLLVFDDDGEPMFRRQCIILGEYPGDTSLTQPYTPCAAHFIRVGDHTIIVTLVMNSYPARTHVRFWRANGDAAGWYINAGSIAVLQRPYVVIDGVGLCFLAYNNRMECVSLCVLPYDSSSGASPPYEDSSYDLTHWQAGESIALRALPTD